MPEIANQLADLTSLRDRDALHIALVKTISDILQTRTTAIYRRIGEAGNEHWLTCAKLDAGQLTPVGDPAWVRLSMLPPLCDHPLRQQASVTQHVVQTQTSDGVNITIFPLSPNAGTQTVMEIGTAEPLSEDAVHAVRGVLRLYLNFQSLLDYGERDELTELLNRKTFDDAFLKATLEQQRTSDDAQDDRRQPAPANSYWLAVVDIDHFKRVNDNYGHLIGDEVLLLLARLMRSCFRFHDQLYRFGGEEFVVLMRCNDEAEATCVLERLRASTEAHLFPQVGHITVSIGFSEIKTGDTPSGAFERADKALYHAKEHGRNQVCSHAALIAGGELIEQAANIGDIELF